MEFGRTCYWVGAKDLRMTFEIRDAGTGEPIRQAEVMFALEGGEGFDYTELFPQRLHTDDDGVASLLLPKMMCYGSDRIFTRSFAIRLPGWRYRAAVDGYEASDWTPIDSIENHRLVQRGNQTASLALMTPLRKTNGKMR
jgi:hypothetical protein